MTTTLPISPAAQALIDAVKACKGQFINAAFTSTVKPAAANKHLTLTKETVGVFRSGIDYAQLASVKEGIASGERGEVESLPWGQWALFPWIIVHKETEYIRLYPVAGNIPAVTYFVDGTEVAKIDFQAHLTPSQLADKEAPACITKKLAEIHFLGCYTGAEVEATPAA